MQAADSKADVALIDAARDAVRKNYDAATENHTVGSALRCVGGRVYVGVNVYSLHGACAEFIAVGAAITAGEREFTTIVAVRGPDGEEILPPRGNCRQMLADYAPDCDVIVPVDGGAAKVKARDLLPFPYHVDLATECGSVAASLGQAELLRDFPTFTKNPLNKVAPSAQHTEGIEGYVFDGADGSQMAFWTCDFDAETAEHVHDFDEYFIVVAGAYLLTLDGTEVRVGAGQECHIPRGTRISGRAAAGTRTIHVFGGHRAERAVRAPGAATEPD